MPREQLRNTLGVLREQLEHANDIDDDVADEIREALGQIGEALDGGKPTRPFDTLRKELTAAADDFEDSHPSLASTLGQIGDLLARVGI